MKFVIAGSQLLSRAEADFNCTLRLTYRYIELGTMKCVFLFSMALVLRKKNVADFMDPIKSETLNRFH